MNTQRPVTHLVIVDYVSSYDGITIIECHSEVEAVEKFNSVMDHHADVRLVEVKRESTYVSRRVAWSVDQ